MEDCALPTSPLHVLSIPFSQVLEDLVKEDDSNPHTWHLLGTAYYAGGMLEEAQVIGHARKA